MKKILSAFGFVIAVFFCYTSCQKGGNKIATNSRIISDQPLASIIAGKRFFYSSANKIKHTVTESTNDTVNGFNPIKSLDMTFRWDLAFVFKGGVVVVPIHFANSLSVQTNISGNTAKKSINNIYKLIIYRDSLNQYQAEVVSWFEGLNNTQQDREGVAYVQNLSGDFLRGYSFLNGKISSISLDHAQTSNSSKTPTDEVQENTVCNYIEWYDCGTNGCSFESEEFLGCTTTTDGGTGITINQDDYATIGTTPAPSPDSIVNILVNPCLIAVFNKLTANGLKNEISNILQNIFGTSDDITLTEKQVASLPPGEDAATYATFSPPNFYFVTTSYSSAVMQTASQEFIAETMFHEALHGYLSVNTTVKGELPQHCQMINSYVDCELAALQEVFPTLSSHDGLCLILGGMGQVQQYDADTFNTELQHYNLTNNDVVATNTKYQTSALGTACGGLN